jgi:hypothetical protein
MDLRQLNKYKDKMKLEKLFVSILAAAALFVGCKDNGENSELPALSVNPTEITIDKAGGSQTITVKSNRDWTVKTDADWLAPTPTSGNASKKDATVSVKALANTGYNRTGTVTVSTEFDYKTVTVIQPGDKGEDTTNKPTGSGTQADPYNVAAAINAVKDLTWTSNDSYEKTGPYFVKGKISQIGKDSKTGEDLTYTQSGTYSNATFYISDDGSTGNEFYCYRVSYLGNKKFITGQTDIKVGDEVVIYGELMNYRGNTPETVQGSAYLYSLNGETQGQGGDEVQEVTVAQAIAAQKDALLKVGPALVIASSQAGFLIEQDGARLYVYGKTANVGDNVTVTATRGEYSKVAQLTDVTEIITNSTGNAVTHPTPKDITSTFDSYSSDTREYVTFKGTLSISGNYFNIAVEGASTYTGALVKPNEDVSSFNGKVVTVTGYYLYIASSKYLYIIATEIKSDGESPGGDEAKEVTVAQALAAEKDELLKVGPALVIASSQAGFLMEQDGAMIYVYGSTAKVGDNVTVTATRGEYSGVAQLTNATAVVTNSTGNTVTYPSPKDITSTFDSYSSTTHEYVTFKGTLSISSGKYFNIAVEGASTLTGSIVTPNQDISALNGKVVSITGYFLYIASSKYLYVIATEIKGEGGETPPGPGGDEDFSSNVTWTLGSNAKTEEATVNGKSAVQVLKIGTSSKVGTATVVIPKGTKSVSFYGVSWKGKPASVQVLFGETPLYTQELAANEGAANSSPYTITVKDSDHYSMALPETLTEDVSVTVTTTGTNTRVILFGIKAEK